VSRVLQLICLLLLFTWLLIHTVSKFEYISHSWDTDSEAAAHCRPSAIRTVVLAARRGFGGPRDNNDDHSARSDRGIESELCSMNILCSGI
jgi:hypothetical protein